MSTTKQHLPQNGAPHIDDANVAIVAAEWNAHLNDAMAEAAAKVLKSHGADCQVFHVPGAVELTFAASQLIEASIFDAIIVFGTVIRGGTPHFDYVCQSVTQGITSLNSDSDTPVIFGVLTVDKEKDATDRVDGTAGDKGSECAEAALKMIQFRRLAMSL